MRLKNVIMVTLALALCGMSAIAAPAVFGSVVSIGGSASDIALDESRGVLYIANFGASSIHVMSTADNTVHSSIGVAPFPGAIALSPDSQYLVVAHFCNVAAKAQTSPACANEITSIHLTDNSQQIFSLASSPLGVAFLGTGQALIVTTTNILTFVPATGQTQLVSTLANVASTLPVAAGTFPGQITEASLSSSADGKSIWGIASAGSGSSTGTQFIFQYSGGPNPLVAISFTSSPVLLPRISSSADGSFALTGYVTVTSAGYLKSRYPAVAASTNITGGVIDSVNGLIYGQFPDANQPAGPQTANAGAASAALPAAMLILDSDNMTFRGRISIPEDMVGRAVLNAAATNLYVVSESGVMVLPVGALNSNHRVVASVEDLLVATSFCNRSTLTQTLTVTDPGGGQTAFTLSTKQSGVTIQPSSGVTPATVKVIVDPTVVPGSGGTAAITLTLSSQSAINQPRPVRLLVNNPDPSQHGTVIDQPGVLSDILPDPARNRIYVLRQDLNQLLVFDGGSMQVLATLRTATSPTTMAMTADSKYLLVGHDDSQVVGVFDLNALQPVAPIILPGGHYARSIAVSNAAILALVRNEGSSGSGTTGSSGGVIDSINLIAGNAAALPSLGPYVNSVSPTAVLTAAPGRGSIFLASPDGTVMLYSAAANTFVNSRHDLASASGAYAASDFGTFVIGNSVLDASLVPAGFVSASPLTSSGFAFVDQGGYSASAASASAAGSLVRLSSLQSGAASSITTSEAPLLSSSTGTVSNGYGVDGSGSPSLHSTSSFSRTIAAMPNNGTVVVLSTSGLTVLASSYPAAATPGISAIVSAASGSSTIAPGELVSIYGQNLSAVSLAANATPLSTALGDSCLGANGIPIPLLFVSPQQINAQLPFSLTGSSTLAIHTPSGVSNTFSFTVAPTAPDIFTTGAAGPTTGIALIIRDDNGQLITPTNPIHPKDTITIYLTGMGVTTPAVVAGQPSPSSPLAVAAVAPSLKIGGAVLSVSFAGLAPGEVGVYQINAVVPASVPAGLSIPLEVTQGGVTTTINVRVVD